MKRGYLSQSVLRRKRYFALPLTLTARRIYSDIAARAGARAQPSKTARAEQKRMRDANSTACCDVLGLLL